MNNVTFATADQTWRRTHAYLYSTLKQRCQNGKGNGNGLVEAPVFRSVS